MLVYGALKVDQRALRMKSKATRFETEKIQGHHYWYVRVPYRCLLLIWRVKFWRRTVSPLRKFVLISKDVQGEFKHTTLDNVGTDVAGAREDSDAFCI